MINQFLTDGLHPQQVFNFCKFDFISLQDYEVCNKQVVGW
jgi:hypothetical protein